MKWIIENIGKQNFVSVINLVRTNIKCINSKPNIQF